MGERRSARNHPPSPEWLYVHGLCPNRSRIDLIDSLGGDTPVPRCRQSPILGVPHVTTWYGGPTPPPGVISKVPGGMTTSQLGSRHRGRG